MGIFPLGMESTCMDVLFYGNISPWHGIHMHGCFVLWEYFPLAWNPHAWMFCFMGIFPLGMECTCMDVLFYGNISPWHGMHMHGCFVLWEYFPLAWNAHAWMFCFMGIFPLGMECTC